jgi:hypothetical protein
MIHLLSPGESELLLPGVDGERLASVVERFATGGNAASDVDTAWGATAGTTSGWVSSASAGLADGVELLSSVSAEASLTSGWDLGSGSCGFCAMSGVLVKANASIHTMMQVSSWMQFHLWDSSSLCASGKRFRIGAPIHWVGTAAKLFALDVPL